MPLHLVGENIDNARSHYLAESGKLLKLHRGVCRWADGFV
jgi:serine/threonine-protein kinase HipA